MHRFFFQDGWMAVPFNYRYLHVGTIISLVPSSLLLSSAASLSNSRKWYPASTDPTPAHLHAANWLSLTLSFVLVATWSQSAYNACTRTPTTYDDQVRLALNIQTLTKQWGLPDISVWHCTLTCPKVFAFVFPPSWQFPGAHGAFSFWFSSGLGLLFSLSDERATNVLIVFCTVLKVPLW